MAERYIGCNEDSDAHVLVVCRVLATCRNNLGMRVRHEASLSCRVC
jgi:hypothetical protein